MHNPKTNTITFPHVWYGDKIAGKVHKYNSINDGFVTIADLGMKLNSFFGGNVDKLGRIKEYGFYLCTNRWNNSVAGFYVHDPKEMTELGKSMFEAHFAGITIQYEPVVVKQMTSEEKSAWDELKKDAINKGLGVELVEHTSAEGLVNAMATIERGVNANAAVMIEQSAKEPVSKNPTIITKIGKPQF